MDYYKVIGLMSGTSMDGVDIACCTFKKSESWTFSLDAAITVPYTGGWAEKFSELMGCKAPVFAETHAAYGRYLGTLVKDFITSRSLKPDFVSSHGHTIFHQPALGFTSQIGDGAAIAALCGHMVICDFRSMDVALGGQGAPLVPIGDRLLFGLYDYCLNLGGIANISFEKNGQRIAFDICPANLVLNRLAAELGQEYDEGGALAERGKLNEELFLHLENLDFYRNNSPKSLGREWVETEFFPVLERFSISAEDKLRTTCEHIASRIASCIQPGNGSSLLITGGGAFNTFLAGRIRERCASVQLVIPDASIVNFKEAIIFAFLGVLRMRGEVNTLSSVTGASQDSSGGCIYLAP